MDPASQRRWRHLISGLFTWLAGVEGRVINRPGHATDNALKAWHEVLIAQKGFHVPESIITSKKRELLDFLVAGRAIAKSLSGVRSDAREVVCADLEDYTPNQGPVHLQRLVKGLDVRVHVVHNESFAVAIKSSSVDYRVSASKNGYKCFRLPKKIHDSLIEATCGQGLELAGWDFKVDRSGAFWCLECNPMPGFSSYDIRGNLAISRAVLRRLSIASKTQRKRGDPR